MVRSLPVQFGSVSVFFRFDQLDPQTLTPLLVRRKEVAGALEWLKLNHKNYADLTISYDELNRYPVTIESSSNKIPEATSVFDLATDEGVQNGNCPFVVHGITGEQLTTKTVAAQKGIALQHWNNNGPGLSVSHASETQSIYNNPDLYPQIFPWLFPYGLGGIGATPLSDKAHKHYLLMYHDKRFQLDVSFL
jgi:hypothetical protein